MNDAPRSAAEHALAALEVYLSNVRSPEHLDTTACDALRDYIRRGSALGAVAALGPGTSWTVPLAPWLGLLLQYAPDALLPGACAAFVARPGWLADLKVRWARTASASGVPACMRSLAGTMVGRGTPPFTGCAKLRGRGRGVATMAPAAESDPVCCSDEAVLRVLYIAYACMRTDTAMPPRPMRCRAVRQSVFGAHGMPAATMEMAAANEQLLTWALAFEHDADRAFVSHSCV